MRYALTMAVLITAIIVTMADAMRLDRMLVSSHVEDRRSHVTRLIEALPAWKLEMQIALREYAAQEAGAMPTPGFALQIPNPNHHKEYPYANKP
jgi:hypothetical protein